MPFVEPRRTLVEATPLLRTLLITTGCLLLTACSGGAGAAPSTSPTTVTAGSSAGPTPGGGPTSAAGAPGATRSAGTGSASTGPAPGGAPTLGPRAAVPPGATALTITVDDGAGQTTGYHLTCAPTGGDLPHAQAACDGLAGGGWKALRPPPQDLMCTQIYGGPQTARITGTWQGTRVEARLNRVNGCEIARWQALTGLLPGPT